MALALTLQVSAATGANAMAPVAAATAVAASVSRARAMSRFQPAWTNAAQSARISGPAGTGPECDGGYGRAPRAWLLALGLATIHPCGEQQRRDAPHRRPSRLPADVRERPAGQALARPSRRARPAVRARRGRLRRTRGHARPGGLLDHCLGSGWLRLL